jgi:hypothetical protein
MAELQYAKKELFSSALRKIPYVERVEINRIVNQTYEKMIKTDLSLTRTDILRLLASLGAFSALQDPSFKGSS